MKKLLCCALSLCLLLGSCKNGDQSTSSHDTDNVPQPKVNWYKRYTGTIAGMPVTVNLCFFEAGQPEAGPSSVAGSYYYNNKSQVIDLLASGGKADSVVFSESLSTENTEDQDDKQAKWIVAIGGSTLQGRWISKDQAKEYTINLKEDYSGDAYPLAIIASDDSATFQWKTAQTSVTVSLWLLAPGSMDKDDAHFLEQSLLQAAGDSLHTGQNPGDELKKISHSYISEYNNDMAELRNNADEGPDADDEEQYNYEITLHTSCDYNAKGILVFEFDWYAYEGGAHANNWTRTLCVDMKARKKLGLNDVLTVDSLKLSRLLEEEARKYFKISAADTLSNTLLVDTIPPTNDFLVSDRGLTFCYSPYAIAAYVYGTVELFLPYDKLRDLLKPEFKKRMNL